MHSPQDYDNTASVRTATHLFREATAPDLSRFARRSTLGSSTVRCAGIIMTSIDTSDAGSTA